MCCRSLPGVFGCPNAIDFGQLTGASPSTFMLEDSALPFVSHPIFPSWPHCRDQRLPRKQAHLHTKLQARASRVQWAGTCGTGQLKGSCTLLSPNPVCFQLSSLHIPGCPQALGGECAATCRAGYFVLWPCLIFRCSHFTEWCSYALTNSSVCDWGEICARLRAPRLRL